MSPDQKWRREYVICAFMSSIHSFIGCTASVSTIPKSYIYWLHFGNAIFTRKHWMWYSSNCSQLVQPHIFLPTPKRKFVIHFHSFRTHHTSRKRMWWEKFCVSAIITLRIPAHRRQICQTGRAGKKLEENVPVRRCTKEIVKINTLYGRLAASTAYDGGCRTADVV